MKTILFEVRHLIQSKLLLVTLCVLGSIAIGKQLSEITSPNQKSIYRPETFHREIKEEIPEEDKQIEENRQEIQQYAQKIKDLSRKIETYTTQNARSNAIKGSKSPPATLPSQPVVSQFTSSTSNPKSPSNKASQTKTSQTALTFRPPSLKISQNHDLFPLTLFPQPSSQNFKGSAPTRADNNSQGRTSGKLEESAARHLGKLTETGTILDQSIGYANDVVYGLAIAVRNGQIKYGTQPYRRVQSAIRLLRRGESKENAAERAKVPVPLLEQLIAWGQARYGGGGSLVTFQYYSVKSCWLRQAGEAGGASGAEGEGDSSLSEQYWVTFNIPTQSNEFVGVENQRNQSIHHANDIAYGLGIADRKGQINKGTSMHGKVQDAIILLRRGKSLEKTARQSTVPLPVLKQLIKWGENRPGSSNGLTSEISLLPTTAEEEVRF